RRSSRWWHSSASPAPPGRSRRRPTRRTRAPSLRRCSASRTGSPAARRRSSWGWTMSALGLNSAGAADLQISDELQEINVDLVSIDDELGDIDAELDLQTCEDAADSTTFDATAQITSLNTNLEEYQDVGEATETQVTDFVEDVLDSDTDSITYQLVALNLALLDQGSIPGVISLCLATLDTPTAGTAGDTDYYDDVSNLLGYF